MDSDIVVVDEIEKSADFDGAGSEDQINPEPTDLPVIEETTKAVEIEIEEEDEEEEDKEEMDMAAKSEEAATLKAEEPEVVKSEDGATTAMISEISESLTSALSTLAETVKALDAKIEGINKAVAGISSEVEEVKDSFGKRVDAVEKDTAFRKSADLGEILQEEPIMEKSQTSTWGGRFLTNADL